MTAIEQLAQAILDGRVTLERLTADNDIPRPGYQIVCAPTIAEIEAREAGQDEAALEALAEGMDY